MYIYFKLEGREHFTDPHIARLPRHQQVAAMTYGVACTETDEGDKRTWHHEEVDALWNYLAADGVRVVGFNCDQYDVPLLAQTLNVLPSRTFNPIDLFAIIKQQTGRWYALNTLGASNLGWSRGSGSEVPEWLHSNDPALIDQATEYCRRGVELIAGLHRQLKQKKPILLPGQPVQNDFSEYYFYLDPHPRYVLADPKEPAILE